MAKKVLVISAHPDDEILGLGGTLKRHSVNGDSVSILIVANIGTARYDKKTIKLVEDSTLRCAMHLGIEDVRFSNFDDQMLDSIPIINITQKIETIIPQRTEYRIINHINNNVRFQDISYTQFLNNYAKDIFTSNGNAWEIMSIPEMMNRSLYLLRANNKYLSINYLRVRGVKYDFTNPLITNSILARMGNEMLNRS